MEMLIFISIAIALAVLYWLGTRRAGRVLADRFAERASLDFSTFYQNYYEGKVERSKVEELLAHVAHELSIPMDKLLPTDRFDVELRPARGWEFDSGKGILMIELDKLARAKSRPLDTRMIATLDDYLKAMAEVY